MNELDKLRNHSVKVFLTTSIMLEGTIKGETENFLVLENTQKKTTKYVHKGNIVDMEIKNVQEKRFSLYKD